MNEENKYYRYCFSCDKWKNKSEINETNQGNNHTFNCDTCQKDLGDNLQIFRCKKHPEEILKVSGVLEGQNKEKVFYEQCPQAQQQEPSFWDKFPMPAKVGSIAALLIGLLATVKVWLSKANQHVEKMEDKLETIKNKVVKKKKDDNEVIEPQE